VLAAVDRQGRAGDETGILVAQESDSARDLIGLSEPPDRNPSDDLAVRSRQGASQVMFRFRKPR